MREGTGHLQQSSSTHSDSQTGKGQDSPVGTSSDNRGSALASRVDSASAGSSAGRNSGGTGDGSSASHSRGGSRVASGVATSRVATSSAVQKVSMRRLQC